MNNQGMGGHSLPNEGISKIWLTPPEILKVLGEFDLDPCAAPSPRPWSTAKRHIELPEDGLSVEWAGRVFLNPPYTQQMGVWLKKMAEHGSGIALVFARTETKIWQKYIWPYANSILFISGRLFFHYQDGHRGESNSGAPSVLIAYSESDTKILEESGIDGYLVKTAVQIRRDKNESTNR
jgi:hypothetical protein